MIKIQTSPYTKCQTCKLLDSPSCIAETNSKDDLTKVEVIFVAENPGKDEIELGVPLIGRAGQLFRKFFDTYIKNDFKWLLTNCVWCLTINPDGTTGNPTDDIIHHCKNNCFELIKKCNPKLIILMGTSALKAFDIAESGITNLRGQTFEWEGFDVFVTVHPSFVNRNRSWEPTFEEDIKTVSDLLRGETKVSFESKKEGIHFYELPTKYYSKNYRLVDVQHINESKKIIYIFRDKDNNKEYYETNDNYYCYQCEYGDEREVIPYEQLKVIELNYYDRNKVDRSITHEGDFGIDTKHTLDYFIRSKDEPITDDLNIMFLDIEVYSPTGEFPNTEEVKFPVVVVTYYYHDKEETLFFDIGETKDIDKKQVIEFDSEKELLAYLIKKIREEDPDIITAWNLGYDLGYIVNRCKKIGLDPTKLSPYGRVDIDPENGYFDIVGYVCLDLLRLYKSFTFTKKESYALGFIAQDELGYGKVELEGDITEQYTKYTDIFVKYNKQDVKLLIDLEKKLKYIALQNELRKICGISFRNSLNMMGQVDGLILKFFKGRGLSPKNSKTGIEKGKVPGAYVLEPQKGLHDWIVDLDFTSLYPSLILTYNIGLNTFLMKFKDYTMGYDFIYQPEELPEEIEIVLKDGKEITVEKTQFLEKVKEKGLICTINGCFFKNHKEELSFYYEIMEMLLSSRKEYKNKMFEKINEGDKVGEQLYNMRQLVYKVLANAIYGVLANEHFRFYRPDFASAITLSGQEAIKTVMVGANLFLQEMKKGNLIETIEEKNYTLGKNEMYGDIVRNLEFIVTGDTDSIFVKLESFTKTSEQILNKIFETCKYLENFLNNKLVSWLVQKHHVSMNFSRLNLKNELVIKRGLFLAKKRYSIYVINNEGEEVDDFKFMGLEIKRSDYPSFAKENMVQLLNMLLKEDAKIVDVLSFVKEKEKEVREKILEGNVSTARPVSFTKPLSKYKQIPQNVIAMLNWNSLITNTFIPGMRGYMFWVKGIDLEKAPKHVVDNYKKNFQEVGKKIKEVAVPQTYNRLPEFFILDIKEAMKFCWTDRYSLLLEPLLKMETKILTF